MYTYIYIYSMYIYMVRLYPLRPAVPIFSIQPLAPDLVLKRFPAVGAG